MPDLLCFGVLALVVGLLLIAYTTGALADERRRRRPRLDTRRSPMLVLTRKVGEDVWIGEDIRVVVVAVDRGKIRLGFQVPPDTLILRGELLPLPPHGPAPAGPDPVPSTPAEGNGHEPAP